MIDLVTQAKPSSLNVNQLAYDARAKVLYLGVGGKVGQRAQSVEAIGGVGGFVDLASSQTVKGAKQFAGADLDFASAKSLKVPLVTTEDATDAVASARLVDLKINANMPHIDVRDFGPVKLDGKRDNTAENQKAIDAAAAAGGGFVYTPNGDNLTHGLTLRSNVTLKGASQWTSRLKLVPGANQDLIAGEGAASLWGSHSNGGLVNWGVETLQLDGSATDFQGIGSGIAVYGQRGRVRDVNITACNDHGMRTEWGDWGSDVFGMDPFFENCHISMVGKVGWINEGAHDTVAVNVIVDDASQTADNTYDCYHLGSSGQYISLHAWNNGLTGKRHRYGCYADGYLALSHADFEGSKSGNLYIAPGGRVQMGDTCCLYNAFNGAPNVIICTPLNVIRGILEVNVDGLPDARGIILGTAADQNIGGNVIDVQTVNLYAGVIDWTFSKGNNSVTVRGWQDHGISYIGTPHVLDDRDVVIAGTGGISDWVRPRLLVIGGNLQSAGAVQAAGDVEAGSAAWLYYKDSTAMTDHGIDGKLVIETYNGGAGAELQIGTVNYGGTVLGTADAMQVSYDPPFLSLRDGQEFTVVAPGANALTNPSVTIDATPTQVIYKRGGAALAVADYVADMPLKLQYVRGRMILLNPIVP